MFTPNIHTLTVYADLLCVGCRACGHRNALTSKMIYGHASGGQQHDADFIADDSLGRVPIA
jgi:hypothetical protein